MSNLQYVDLNSSRNIFILGISLFFGLSLPIWMQTNDVIHTGKSFMFHLQSKDIYMSHYMRFLTIWHFDKYVQPHFKLRKSKYCSFSSLTDIEYSSDLQRI